MRRHLLFWLVAASAACVGVAALCSVSINIPGYNIVTRHTGSARTRTRAADRPRGARRRATRSSTPTRSSSSSQDRVIARGNVVLMQGNNRIAADRAEFNTKTHLGTFYRRERNGDHPAAAADAATRRDRRAAGGRSTTDVVFFGEMVEKIGNKKYKITNGGFSACVQPTPRWDLHAGTVDPEHRSLHVAAAGDLQGQGRADVLHCRSCTTRRRKTAARPDFCFPTYGFIVASRPGDSQRVLLGDHRSQDATFLYDWYSKTGQGGGGEYRLQPRRRHGWPADASTGSTSAAPPTTVERRRDDVPAQQSFTVNGNANQMLPVQPAGAARASTTSRASRPTRRSTPTSTIAASNNRNYGGNVVGGWGSYSLNGTFDRNENFSARPPVVRLRAARRASRCQPRRTAAVLETRRSTSRGDGDRAPRSPVKQTRRRGRRRPVARPLRFHPADPLSVQAVAVVHRQLVGQLARHVLHAELSIRRHQPRRSTTI